MTLRVNYNGIKIKKDNKMKKCQGENIERKETKV